MTSPIDMNRTFEFMTLNFIFMKIIQLRSRERDTGNGEVRQFWCNERVIHTASWFCVVTDI